MRLLVMSLLCGVVVMGLGCGRKVEHGAEASPSLVSVRVESDVVMIPAESPMLKQIRVAPVQTAEAPTEEVTAPGKIEANPNRMAHIVLPVTGRITHVTVHLGDTVQEGQPLFTVQSPDADAAMSAYLQAQGSVTQAKATLGKTQADYDRMRDLYEHNAVARKDVLDTENMLTQAKATLEQTMAAYDQAVQRLSLLGLKPGTWRQEVVVRAPLTGKVLEMRIVPGEFRNDTSTSLMTIADLSSVWVVANVPESYIRFVQVGEPVEINLVAYPGETFQGHVMRLADIVNPQTRTIEVRVELPNPQERFLPEMFGSIHHIEAKQVVPVAPVSAILQKDAETVIYVECGVGCFRLTSVTVGKRRGEMAPILSGVHPGDRVVVDGGMLLSGLGSQPSPTAREENVNNMVGSPS